MDCYDFNMDLELKIYLFFTRRFPNIKGFGRLRNIIRAFYNRKKREKVISKIFSFRMEIDPSEHVDAEILFSQYYERLFTNFIMENLKPKDIFIDIGANVGFYSLLAYSLGARVIAIEADPDNFERLKRNIDLNNFSDIVALNIGVSDKNEVLKLGRNYVGNNRGGNSFVLSEEHTSMVDVECFPLFDILQKHKSQKVDFMKMDIEGFEKKVLKNYFSKTSVTMLPKFLLIEDNPYYTENKIVEFLKEYKYKDILAENINLICIQDCQTF